MLWEILICKVGGEVPTLLNAGTLIKVWLYASTTHWQVKIIKLLHKIVLQKGTYHAHVISYLALLYLHSSDRLTLIIRKFEQQALWKG